MRFTGHPHTQCPVPGETRLGHKTIGGLRIFAGQYFGGHCGSRRRNAGSETAARAVHLSAAMRMSDPETLFAALIIAVVAIIPLAFIFGLTRRTILVAVGLAIGVRAFYPGGTAGLVIDALRPMRALLQGQKDHTTAHAASVREAADGHAP